MRFMPETARRYGLRVDAQNDERTDPAKSAPAATRYLQDLFSHFGDWRLALAGYNAGEARVEQAIHRSGARELDLLLGLLPLETRRYVPAVMLGIPAESTAPTNPSRPERVSALLAP
jgi:membrane-bound lytic murein transglycosylase D